MSTHPNAILMVVFTPDNLTRKTYRAMLAEFGEPEDSDGYVSIDGKNYHSLVMEEDYSESQQIGAKEGDIVFWCYMTYGYGETVEWSVLESQKNSLEQWAKGVCERLNCKYSIVVSANYW